MNFHVQLEIVVCGSPTHAVAKAGFLDHGIASTLQMLGPLDSAIFSSCQTMLIFGSLTPGNTPNLMVISPLFPRCVAAN
jgi:hypothetical protein